MDSAVPHKKVLYIEDDDFDLLAMQRAFAAAGCTDWLYAARDGGEALEWLQGTGKYADRSQYPVPDLVLLDIRLPKASGLDVLRWIRDQPLLGALPVIMFSGSGHDEDVADAYRVGANVYLCKPLGEKLPAVVRFLVAWLDLDPAPCVNKTEWRLLARRGNPFHLPRAA
jgi:CheY-like chemotaxis protein